MNTTSTTGTVTLEVAGMSCGSCKRHVESALAGVAGVAAAEVDLAAGRATVSVDAGAATADRLIEAVREAGYEAEVAGESSTGLRILPSGGCCSTGNA